MKKLFLIFSVFLCAFVMPARVAVAAVDADALAAAQACKPDEVKKILGGAKDTRGSGLTYALAYAPTKGTKPAAAALLKCPGAKAWLDTLGTSGGKFMTSFDYAVAVKFWDLALEIKKMGGGSAAGEMPGICKNTANPTADLCSLCRYMNHPNSCPSGAGAKASSKAFASYDECVAWKAEMASGKNGSKVIIGDDAINCNDYRKASATGASSGADKPASASSSSSSDEKKCSNYFRDAYKASVIDKKIADKYCDGGGRITKDKKTIICGEKISSALDLHSVVGAENYCHKGDIIICGINGKQIKIGLKCGTELF
jgi:hypothetical protein